MKLDPPVCPLWNQCEGRVRKSRGHLRLDDVIRRFIQVDSDTWDWQYLCKQGSRKGLVIPNWSPAENVTEDAEYVEGLGPTLWFWDYGFSDPFVLYWAQLTPAGEVHVFDGVYVTQHLADEVLDYVHDPGSGQFFCRDFRTGEVRGPYAKPRLSIGDASSPDVAKLIHKRCRVRDISKVMKIVDRVSVMRRYVCDNMGRRLKVHPRVYGLPQEIETWHRVQYPDGTYGELPAENAAGSNPDHACDAVSYGLYWIDQGYPRTVEARVLGGGREEHRAPEEGPL